MRHSVASPCPLWLIEPSVINILPLKAKVKHQVTSSPPLHYPQKFEITFCVRGVISPLLSNLYLNEVDRMLERAKEVTRHERWTAVEYACFADDLVILVDSQPRQQWLRQAVEKRLREELAKLQVQVNEEKSRKVELKRGESFGFLGFELHRVRSPRGRWMPLLVPKGTKRTALLGKLK
jgi:RNA-directed DNA polymerase